MPYQVYYPSGCDTAVGDHQCSNCSDIEHGKIRSVAFIKKSKIFANYSNPVEWKAAIANKDVIIIPSVIGTFDGGSEQEGPGYGNQETKLLGYNFTANYKDPDYKANANFYNAIKLSSNYKFAFVTETQIHPTEVSVQVIPKNPVTDVITSEVVWDVNVKWSDGDLPIPYDAPAGIFDTCFDYV